MSTPPQAFTPTLEQVTRHIAARGPFDTTSKPSSTQILDLAGEVALSLSLELSGVTLTVDQTTAARIYVEHATAAQVEWGWYPEQQDPDGAGRQQDAWAGLQLARLRVSLGLPERAYGAQKGTAKTTPASGFPDPAYRDIRPPGQFYSTSGSYWPSW